MITKQNERVSVIIPTRNRPGFLEQCVRSVLAQTLPAFETIIVNDGSDDIFQEGIERIANLSNRIHLYNFPENRGRSFSRNFGLDRAKGDYILFLDDDDFLEPQMLATGLPHFQDVNIDVVTCLCKVMYPVESQKKFPRVSYLFDCSIKRISSSKMLYLERAPFACIWRWCPPIHSSVIRKDSLKGIRFPEELTTGEDWYLWLSLANANRRFKCNPEAYVHVRRHDSNTMARPSWFSGERTQFLERIVQSGMIQTHRDVAILNLRLFLNQAPTNLPVALKNLLTMMRSPVASVAFARDYISHRLNLDWIR